MLIWKVQLEARSGCVRDEETDFLSCTNTCRDDLIEWRYKGQGRIAWSKVLKKQ